MTEPEATTKTETEATVATSGAVTETNTAQSKEVPIPGVTMASDGELIEAFKRMDANSDNVLSKEEINNFLKARNFNEDFVRNFIEGFDLNGDGKVTYEEYCQKLGLIPEGERKYSVWYSVFQSFDKDNSGFIETSEIAGVLEGLPKIQGCNVDVSKYDPEAFQRWVLEFDADKDGKINYQEFLTFVRSSEKK